MTHSVGWEGVSGRTWIDSILILDFIRLSVNNSGLNIYSYDHDPFVCSINPPVTRICSSYMADIFIFLFANLVTFEHDNL